MPHGAEPQTAREPSLSFHALKISKPAVSSQTAGRFLPRYGPSNFCQLLHSGRMDKQTYLELRHEEESPEGREKSEACPNVGESRTDVREQVGCHKDYDEADNNIQGRLALRVSLHLLSMRCLTYRKSHRLFSQRLRRHLRSGDVGSRAESHVQNGIRQNHTGDNAAALTGGGVPNTAKGGNEYHEYSLTPATMQYERATTGYVEENHSGQCSDDRDGIVDNLQLLGQTQT